MTGRAWRLCPAGVHLNSASTALKSPCARCAAMVALDDAVALVAEQLPGLTALAVRDFVASDARTGNACRQLAGLFGLTPTRCAAATPTWPPWCAVSSMLWSTAESRASCGCAAWCAPDGAVDYWSSQAGGFAATAINASAPRPAVNAGEPPGWRPGTTRGAPSARDLPGQRRVDLAGVLALRATGTGHCARRRPAHRPLLLRPAGHPVHHVRTGQRRQAVEDPTARLRRLPGRCRCRLLAVLP